MLDKPRRLNGVSWLATNWNFYAHNLKELQVVSCCWVWGRYYECKGYFKMREIPIDILGGVNKFIFENRWVRFGE